MQQLSLWGNQLSGSIPTTLGNLTNLTTLSISVNNFDGPIPDLSRLTSLQYLYLQNNQLSGEIPATLNSITTLLQLSLSNNQLSGTIPDLSRLTLLQYLYLSNNQLSGTIPDLSSLTSLTALSLSRNELSGGIPASLNSLTGLTQLALTNNQLSGTIPDLSALTSLTTLYLSGNQLSGTIPDLSALTGLQFLRLSGNQLSGDFPAELGNLTNLKLARFASNTDADGNPSLSGCVPIGLRYLVAAEEVSMGVPAHDFIPVDANNDGNFDHLDDTPGLGLPFCMLSALTFSDVTSRRPSPAARRPTPPPWPTPWNLRR